MDDIDATAIRPPLPTAAAPTVQPATVSAVAPPAIPATSLAGPVTPLAPATTPIVTGHPPVAAAGSAQRAGEPDPTSGTTSSRSGPGRWLAGVVAVSLLSASLASAATVVVLAPSGSAAAAPAAVTTSTSGDDPTPTVISGADAVVAVAESASPAVVTITTEIAGGQGFGPFSMPSTGVGSGFVFDADGLILTNAHVIEGGQQITVTFDDGSEFPGTVVATDTEHDLAVVRVDATGLPTIPIGDSSALKVGQLVVAIGSPLGTYTESVTSGILSATGRTIQVADSTGRGATTMDGLLQTDAAINQGNSGGPLLDAAGNAIGVNVAVATSAQGIGFAVPIADAASIMAEAQAALDAA